MLVYWLLHSTLHDVDLLSSLSHTENGVTASGFIQLEAEDFEVLGLTIIGKRLILRLWKEMKS